jgi:hypothetical protein
MSSGTVYPLRPSAPLTDVTGSSPLLPTPVANPTGRTPEQHLLMRASMGRKSATDLEVALKLLPTPAAWYQGEGIESWEARREREKAKGRNGNGFGVPLDMAIKLLPTPMSRDGRPDGSQNRLGAGSVAAGGGKSVEQVALEEWLSNGAISSPPSDDGSASTDLRLSPWFVEWMMGAPDGWSDPDCLLSATEFKSRWASSPASTSSTASGSE